MIFEEFFPSDTYLPIRVDPRIITVTSASQTKVDDGKPLENHNVTVTVGSLVEGHRLYAFVSGRVDSVGTKENVIDGVMIVDENGFDVTSCYEIDLAFGELTIVSSGD